MNTVNGNERDRPAHNRHIGAIWHGPISIEVRLALSVALSVALVISLLMWIGIRVVVGRLEDDLRETARVTAVAVSDDIELQPETTDGSAIVRVLHDFMSAAPSLQSITVFRTGAGEPSVLASTSSVPTAPLAVVKRTLKSGEPSWQDPTPGMATIAVPIVRARTTIGAVAVSVSLAAVDRLSRAGRLLGISGTVLSIAAITMLIHLLARHLLLAPLQEIRRAMSRVGAGEMHVRARVAQRNELGELAEGLNQMLTEIEDLHRLLNKRVEDATEALRQRNEQLVRSYESVLALRETAARAQQLAAVGQTLANVAHQIGTPLNLVSGHVQLLRQENTDPMIDRRLRIIDEQVARVTDSVRQLLDRARPHSESKRVDVGSMLARLTDAMRPRLAAAGVTIERTIARDMPPVFADETQLELAILNVVTNAVDAMPRGGTLRVRVEANTLGPLIEISDTGVGIPPNLLPRIFEPWLTTKERTRGAGLGLSITHDVVSSLGGTIDVQSTPGSGTTFTIELPATAVAGVQQA